MMNTEAVLTEPTTESLAVPLGGSAARLCATHQAWHCRAGAVHRRRWRAGCWPHSRPGPAVQHRVGYNTGRQRRHRPNQDFERQSDARSRVAALVAPLPAGRLLPGEVLGFGIVTGLAGTIYLVVTLQSPLAAAVAAFTFLTYVFVYTPLKSRTTLNTLLPRRAGCLAAGHRLGCGCAGPSIPRS